jgi:TRAP-type C4-dicarboxylate transport system permease small subunit
MRTVLDRVYGGALALASLCIVAIAVLVLVQVVGRLIDRVALWIGASPLGITVPSLAEIGGFLFVGAAFLALAGTLRAAGHVRVTMLLAGLGPTGKRVMGGVVLVAATALAGFATWNSALQALDSYQFDAVSFGMIRIPLWLPQGVMTLGLGVLLIALLDDLVALVLGDDPAFARAEEAKADGGGGH